MREELAVGLIETRGLVAAIEACDAALKSAEVKLLSIDRVDAGLMTVKIVGEVAAVQSAVDAGRLAAARVGTLVAAHVIARPDVSLHDELIYVEVRPHRKSQNQSLLCTPPALNTKPETPDVTSTSPPRSSETKHIPEHLEKLTVQELRRYARTLPNFPIQGREISRASKETLLTYFRQLNT